MDCFSSDFLEDYIKRSKLRYIGKLKKLELTEEELPLYSDLLCQTLEYSPKIYRKDKKNTLGKKFYIDKDKKETLGAKLRRNSDTSTQTLSFNIERRTSMDDLVWKMNCLGGSNISIKHKLSEIEMKKISHKKESESMVTSIIENIIENVYENRKQTEKGNVKNKNIPFSLKYKRNLKSPLKILSPSKLAKENILILKVFIKQEPQLTTVIDIPCYSNFNTLCDILRFLLEENRLHPKNISLYYFTEHNNKPPSMKFENNIELFLKDIDNQKEISLQTKLVDLETWEVDLLMHNFPDLPEIKCLSYYSQKILNEGSSYSQSHLSKRNPSYYSQEEEIFKMKNNIYSENLDFIPDYKRLSILRGSNTNIINSRKFFIINIFLIFVLRPAYLE